VAVRIVIRGPAELHDDEFEPISDPDKVALVDGLVGGGRELTPEELTALVQFTEGQWSDGLGTHGFYEALDRLGTEWLNVSCKPLGSRGKTRAEQAAG
jgi:hypothetical protein